MTRILAPLRALVGAAAVAGVLAYAAAALLTVADIVGRQISLPVPGVVDLVQLCVLGGAWLVIPYAFLTGAHVGVDLVVDSFPPPVRRTLRIAASLAAVVLLALVLRQSWEAFGMQLMFGDRSQQLGIPIVWYWVPLLAGVALSILASLLTIVDGIKPTVQESAA
ncbi:MAG: TRAP transporter small permease [Caenispirillum bisanense]|nr:TRAP transporter small permease [Caenispirillum bisanense]MCA1973267.1 TRAP transporter small permease [Caenispirillum sp.]